MHWYTKLGWKSNPKRACYHGFVYNSIKDFCKYMSIDYNSIGHIDIKVFGIQSTDTQFDLDFSLYLSHFNHTNYM